MSATDVISPKQVLCDWVVDQPGSAHASAALWSQTHDSVL